MPPTHADVSAHCPDRPVPAQSNGSSQDTTTRAAPPTAQSNGTGSAYSTTPRAANAPPAYTQSNGSGPGSAYGSAPGGNGGSGVSGVPGVNAVQRGQGGMVGGGQQNQAQAREQQPSQVRVRQSTELKLRSRPYHSYEAVKARDSGKEMEKEGIRGARDSNGNDRVPTLTATSPPSPATGSSTTAVVDSAKNSTPVTTTTAIPRNAPAAPDDIPDAPLDPKLENIIHRNGNLHLIVGTTTSSSPQRKLLVHTETIKHFGPQWVEIIKESNRKNLFASRRVASLPDDDADMFLVLMYVSHSWQLWRVPCALSFAQLLAMTRLCEKYDMNMQVSQVIRRWIVPHQEKLLAPGREQWLFVAQQFGLERHYVTLARHLVLKCRSDKETNLLVPGRGKLLKGFVPEDALVEIRHKRMATLTKMLDVAYTLVDSLENGNPCRAALPPSLDEGADDAIRAMCTHCNHGELIRYLKIHKIWPPILRSSIIQSSVDEVFNLLTGCPAISYRHLCTTHTHTPDAASAKSSGDAHAICDAGKQLTTLIMDVRSKIEAPISASTLEVIRGNAEKAGLKDAATAPCYLSSEEPLDEVTAIKSQ